MIIIDSNTTVAELIEYSKSEDWQVRVDVAWDERTPIDILRILMSDEHEMVRQMIACHPKADKEILYKLLEDDFEAVRINASNNSSLARY